MLGFSISPNNVAAVDSQVEVVTDNLSGIKNER